MTRFRKTAGVTGKVVFVGAGPGDPGMLTARAQAALAEAGTVIVDPDVSPAVQDAVRAEHPDLELIPATGEPAEVAKAAVAAAKGGTPVVRLVAGDPYTSDAVVKEVLAVGRTSVPFDVVPGVATATGVPPGSPPSTSRAAASGRSSALPWRTRVPPVAVAAVASVVRSTPLRRSAVTAVPPIATPAYAGTAVAVATPGTTSKGTEVRPTASTSLTAASLV